MEDTTPKLIPEIDIKAKLPEIKARGWVKSLRSSDTGIGYTFETIMGIKENNQRNHDFVYKEALVESKCQRKDSKSMITLFTKEACVRQLNDIQVMSKYGYWDDVEQRYALMDTCYTGQFNAHNLSLLVDKQNRTINMVDIHGNLVWQWLPSDIKLKFINLLLVFAEREKRGKHKYFHYSTAYYLQKFKEQRFLERIEEKKIGIDLRMHLKKSGASRNHGTGFRTKQIEELKVCFEKVEQII